MLYNATSKAILAIASSHSNTPNQQFPEYARDGTIGHSQPSAPLSWLLCFNNVIDITANLSCCFDDTTDHSTCNRATICSRRHKTHAHTVHRLTCVTENITPSAAAPHIHYHFYHFATRSILAHNPVSVSPAACIALVTPSLAIPITSDTSMPDVRRAFDPMFLPTDECGHIVPAAACRPHAIGDSDIQHPASRHLPLHACGKTPSPHRYTRVGEG